MLSMRCGSQAHKYDFSLKKILNLLLTSLKACGTLKDAILELYASFTIFEEHRPYH